MKIFNPLTRRSIKNTEKNRKKMMKFLSEGKVFFNPFTKKFVKRDSGTVLKLLQGKKERWFYNKYSDKLEKRNEAIRKEDQKRAEEVLLDKFIAEKSVFLFLCDRRINE